jgi:ABC-type transport system substrate-binding protein
VGLDVQKQLYDVGVDMQFQVLPVAEYGDRIRRGDFDVVLTDLSSGPTFGRPYTFWRSAKKSKGLNFFGYENAESEELFQVLRTSMSEAAVRSATRRLQRVLLDDPPALFLAWSERTRAIRRDFSVFAEPGADPLLTLSRWTPNTNPSAAPTQ